MMLIGVEKVNCGIDVFGGNGFVKNGSLYRILCLENQDQLLYFRVFSCL